MGVNLKFSCSQSLLVFACNRNCGRRSRCTHTMCKRTCVPVVVCVARKLLPCASYNGCRDRNNSVHWCSLYKGGWYFVFILQSFMHSFIHAPYITHHATVALSFRGTSLRIPPPPLLSKPNLAEFVLPAKTATFLHSSVWQLFPIWCMRECRLQYQG